MRRTFLKTATLLVALCGLAATASAQRTEITLTLNEQFFDSLIDATFKNFDPPAFPIGGGAVAENKASLAETLMPSAFGPSAGEAMFNCGTIKVLRETGGMRTAVRLGEGKLRVPLAFSGSYSMPFVGCVEFAGWADSAVDLEFDAAGRRLLGRVRVESVNMNGTGGVGGSMIASLIQGSVDKKFNPMEILSLDKVSFGLPIPNTGRLKMNAVGLRTEIHPAVMNIHIQYEFTKDAG
ncbi:MAG: hypothetical protein UZ17_ACD001001119 [Acidobacteria bacterium OLB17]|nr:MAG: hypothetical protein UZ17_ACD001001119 [Acidobacteria bacterium OLB17]MCZ2391925.1 hypothetical protein [Acidobacteriota bacterium]